MRWLLYGVLLLIATGCVVLLIGWALPVKHESVASAVVSATPQEVYAAVADVAAYGDWVKGIKRVEILDTVDGRTRFRQQSADGPLVMEVEEAQAPLRFVTRIADPAQPFGGSWTFEFAADSPGTRVTITERGEVYNPLFRFASRFVFGHARTIQNFLSSLQRHLE